MSDNEGSGYVLISANLREAASLLERQARELAKTREMLAAMLRMLLARPVNMLSITVTRWPKPISLSAVVHYIHDTVNDTYL